MGRISRLSIQESVKELKLLLRKQTSLANINRLQTLIIIQENRFRTRYDISVHIGVTRRTIERWLSDYSSGGIDNLLISGKRNRKSSLISNEIHKGLEQRLMNSEQGFISYVDAQRWIESEYDLKLKYNTVREHLIRHFETKIKSPRKSHVKKDPKAVAAFLKTA